MESPQDTTGFLWARGHVFAEIDPAADTVEAIYSHYRGVDRPHGVRRNGATHYYALSPRHSVKGLLDGQGNMVNHYRYGPWGRTESATENVENPYRFIARRYVESAGLYYNRARYYDPDLRRFVSQDPLGLAAGINPYAYAGNDPINAIDPSGLCTIREYGGSVSGGPATISTMTWLASGCGMGGGWGLGAMMMFGAKAWTGSFGGRGVAGGTGTSSPMAADMLSGGGSRQGSLSKSDRQEHTTVDREACLRGLLQTVDVVPVTYTAPPPLGSILNAGVEVSALTALIGDIKAADVPTWRKVAAGGIAVFQGVTIVTGSSPDPVSPAATSLVEGVLLNTAASALLNGTPNFIGATARSCGF